MFTYGGALPHAQGVAFYQERIFTSYLRIAPCPWSSSQPSSINLPPICALHHAQGKYLIHFNNRHLRFAVCLSPPVHKSLGWVQPGAPSGDPAGSGIRADCSGQCFVGLRARAIRSRRSSSGTARFHHCFCFASLRSARQNWNLDGKGAPLASGNSRSAGKKCWLRGAFFVCASLECPSSTGRESAIKFNFNSRRFGDAQPNQCYENFAFPSRLPG